MHAYIRYDRLIDIDGFLAQEDRVVRAQMGSKEMHVLYAHKSGVQAKLKPISYEDAVIKIN